jgi:hypothetical protein
MLAYYVPVFLGDASVSHGRSHSVVNILDSLFSNTNDKMFTTRHSDMTSAFD